MHRHWARGLMEVERKEATPRRIRPAPNPPCQGGEFGDSYFCLGNWNGEVHLQLLEIPQVYVVVGVEIEAVASFSEAG